MTPSNKTLETDIDALLPQTQCGDCGYNGCLPYAKALANGEAEIDLCLPGGVAVLKNLGVLLKQDIAKYIATMQAKTKPKKLVLIREAECIGCTKCIQACPVDAIVGAAKQMHTVLTDECTGCELCIAPCPMDCIDLIATADQSYANDKARDRMLARNKRLAKIALDKKQKHRQAKIVDEKLAFKKQAILQAVARAKAKRK